MQAPALSVHDGDAARRRPPATAAPICHPSPICHMPYATPASMCQPDAHCAPPMPMTVSRRPSCLWQVGETILDPFGNDPEDYALLNFVEVTAVSSHEAINIKPCGPRVADRAGFYDEKEMFAAGQVVRRMIKQYRWRKIVKRAKVQSEFERNLRNGQGSIGVHKVKAPKSAIKVKTSPKPAIKAQFPNAAIKAQSRKAAISPPTPQARGAQPDAPAPNWDNSAKLPEELPRAKDQSKDQAQSRRRHRSRSQTPNGETDKRNGLAPGRSQTQGPSRSQTPQEHADRCHDVRVRVPSRNLNSEHADKRYNSLPARGDRSPSKSEHPNRAFSSHASDLKSDQCVVSSPTVMAAPVAAPVAVPDASRAAASLSASRAPVSDTASLPIGPAHLHA